MITKELQTEAYHEALRRYPDSHSALVFLWTALGLGAIDPTQEHLDWAKSVTNRHNQQTIATAA